MSSRPKPRPKPRARPTAASNNSSSSTSTQAPKIHVLTEEDEDAMFFRNSNRTAQTWKKLNKLTEEKGRSNKRKSDEDDSDSDNDSQGSPHRKYRKKTNNAGLPDWTKMSSDAILISSDEEDQILERVENISDPTEKRTQPHSQQKKNSKQRQRSRSRSITPPPALSADAIRSARERVMQLLNVEKRAPSPTYVADESTDTIVLDPELASIAKQVKSQTLDSGGRSMTPCDISDAVVSLKVRWKCHPLNESGKPEVWEFKLKRHDCFRDTFEEIADAASILYDNLIVTFDDKRIFPSASPQGVGIWAEAEFEACDKATYEYIREQRRRSPSTFDDFTPHSRDLSLPPTQEEEESDNESAAGGGGDTFKLILRSQASKDITLTVRPTTKCSAIVKAFLKAAGLEDKYPSAPVPPKKGGKRGKAAATASLPWLSVDGDKMAPDTEIGDADLEDGDMVEVQGL